MKVGRSCTWRKVPVTVAVGIKENSVRTPGFVPSHAVRPAAGYLLGLFRCSRILFTSRAKCGRLGFPLETLFEVCAGVSLVTCFAQEEWWLACCRTEQAPTGPGVECRAGEMMTRVFSGEIGA